MKPKLKENTVEILQFLGKKSLLLLLVLIISCQTKEEKQEISNDEYVKQKLDKYVKFKFENASLLLKKDEQVVLEYLNKAADIVDKMYWEQVFGDKKQIEKIKKKNYRKFV